jgi:hypothetical protein
MLPDRPRDCKPHGGARRDNAAMPRTVKRLLGAGVLAAAAYAVWRAFDARRVDSNVSWEPQPFPYPPVPHARETQAPAGPTTEPASVDEPGDGEMTPGRGEGAWVEPADGACPATHPVKGKLSSGIFHVPGGANYDRTRADRCYTDPGAAEADGLRGAKA